MRGIFVTATDTGVGKTVVSSVIARLLLMRNIRVGVMKPVTSGCPEIDGRLVSEDAELLAWSAGMDSVSGDAAPYLLDLPIAPWEAARRRGVEIDFHLIRRSFSRVAKSHDFVIVEGAGGLMVPLTDRLLIADLIKYLSLPAVVVCRPGLGTVNHTLLTCLAAKNWEIDIRGLIINDYPDSPGVAEESAPALIGALAEPPILGIIPHHQGEDLRRTVTEVADRLARRPETDLLLKRIGAIL